MWGASLLHVLTIVRSLRNLYRLRANPVCQNHQQVWRE